MPLYHLVPNDWEVVPLSERGKIVMGQSPDSVYVNEGGNGIPFLQGNAEFKTKHPVPLHWVTRPLKIAKHNDILISVRAPVGETNIADQDYCIGRGLAAIRLNTNIDNGFGWYLICYHKRQLERVAQGTTFQAVSSNDLGSLELLIPQSRDEQRQIAAILSTLDNAIEQSEALIQKYQRIKQGLMQDLLASRPTWTTMQLGEACKKGKGSIQTGPFGSQLHSSDYKEEGTPIITVEHLGDNEILQANLPLVGEEDRKRLSRYQIFMGDLVFSRVGAIDRCAYVSERENGWLFSGRCLRVRPGKLFDSKFLAYQLNSSPCRKWILNNAVGSTMKCLNTTILSELPIFIPPKEEQIEIGIILTQADELIMSYKVEHEKLASFKRGLMQDLLTGRVRVNNLLNIQDIPG